MYCTRKSVVESRVPIILMFCNVILSVCEDSVICSLGFTAALKRTCRENQMLDAE